MINAKKRLTTYKIIILMISLLTINLAYASANQMKQLKMVGKGEMSWLFIDLYNVFFYSQTGKYQENEYPQALKIIYLRDIDNEHLVTATQKQWQKLKFDVREYQPWLISLKQLWPDIKKGDELLFLVDADGRGIFYHNNKILGGINSNAFSAAFLSIWLSENSSEPALRKQLIGE